MIKIKLELILHAEDKDMNEKKLEIFYEKMSDMLKEFKKMNEEEA